MRWLLWLFLPIRVRCPMLNIKIRWEEAHLFCDHCPWANGCPAWRELWRKALR